MAPDAALVDDRGGGAQADPAEADGLTAAPKRNRRKRARPQSAPTGPGRRPPSSLTTVSVAPSRAIRFDRGRVRHWFQAADGCAKQRWRRAGSAPDPAAVIQGVHILRYSDDEYADLCQSESWTRSETDLMLDLAERFDQRFVIVADRMQPHRTLEQIKKRFVDVQVALAQSRGLDPVDFPLLAESYYADEETTRREQLELLLTRTPDDERRVARLVLDHHRLEQTIRARRQELNEARRLVRVQKAIAKMSNAVAEGVVKRRSTRPPTEEEQRQNPFSGLPDHVVIGNAFPSPPPGVYLRHQQLLTVPTLVNQKLQKQLETELEEAGMTVQQLPTPTAAVCEMYDRLRQDYLTLFNLQRYIGRKEQDTLQLKQEWQAAQKAAGIASSSASKSKKRPPPGAPPSHHKKLVASKAPASRSIAPPSPVFDASAMAGDRPTNPVDSR